MKQKGNIKSTLLLFIVSSGTMVITLMLSAFAVTMTEWLSLFCSYFSKPTIILLNITPIVLCSFFFFFLTGRCSIGFLSSNLLYVGICVVNYYKINLRADPLLAEDVLKIFEAGNILQNYSLDFDAAIGIVIAYFLIGSVLTLEVDRKSKKKEGRNGFAAILCVVAGVVIQFSVYMDADIYAKVVNNEHFEQYNPTENYLSKGCIYSFLYSVRDAYHEVPQGYQKATARRIYDSYEDAEITGKQKVSVIAIMLEAFADLTDYPVFKSQDKVTGVYQRWHELEERSVSGNLITNAFAGDTVNTERMFLTGDNKLKNYRSDTESYVWYFKDWGYSTFGYHPYHEWFYNRKNVNEYLGFDEYGFFKDIWTEDEKQTWTAMLDSDRELTEKIIECADEKLKEGPFFSFSVSVQNHGPYGMEHDRGSTYLSSKETEFSQETCSIFNNYLYGIEDTINVMCDFVETLNEKDEPIVLCLFGDHKPWGGNGNSAYLEAGISFDLSTLEGVYNYYSTPYLIWANDAAKVVLNKEFSGIGKDISPCFLMTEIFDQCGWIGPGFMQLAREIRDITPVIHADGFFILDGKLCTELPEKIKDKYNQYIQVQFYRRNQKFE